MEKRICPMCRGTSAELLQRDIVRCVTCGEERHHTHWKVPSEHDARAQLVARLVGNIATGRHVLEGVE